MIMVTEKKFPRRKSELGKIEENCIGIGTYKFSKFLKDLNSERVSFLCNCILLTLTIILHLINKKKKINYDNDGYY